MPVDKEVLPAAFELDLREVALPLALLRANRTLAAHASGQQIRVLTAFDDLAVPAFKSLARQTGHLLESQELARNGYLHVFRCR